MPEPNTNTPTEIQLSAKRIRQTLRAFASTVNLGVLAIADDSDFTIEVASKTQQFFGHKDSDLVGKPFAMLLPTTVATKHRAMMEAFKKSEGSSTSRKMGSNMAVQGVTNKGDLVEICVAISYHKGEPGVYLALIQSPNNTGHDPEELHSLQNLVTSMLAPVDQVAKKAWGAIVAKTAAIGFIPLMTLVLTQSTQLIAASRAFITAWGWTNHNPGSDEVDVVQIIGDKTRYENLQLILKAVQKTDKRVLGIGFYSLDPTESGSSQLRYVTDSNTTNGEEIWFFDQTEDRMLLTMGEVESLTQGDCVLKFDGAEFPSRPGRPKANVVLCPTFTIENDPFNQGLRRVRTKNVLAAAVSLDVKKLDPKITRFWVFTPNVENILRK